MFAKLSFLALIGLLSALVQAHSWIEQLSLIGDNGSFVANGYPRAYKARTDPGYDGNSMMWLIPGAQTQRIHINDQDALCHTSQRNPTQSQNYPRLAVAPGSAIAMKYLENGHVTLPANQPGKQAKGGTVFIFGTTQPQPDETLANVLKWTADGSGGNKLGKLLQAQNFDDERCHQINSGEISVARQKQFPNPKPGQTTGQNELWCESNVMIPKDAPVGKLYTIYWVWQWPTMPQNTYPQGKDEYYTTCNDLDVQAQAPETGAFANTLQQQDPQGKPVSDYLSRSALEPTPWPKGVAGASSSGAPSSQTASAATSVAASAPSTPPAAAGAEPPAATQNAGQASAPPAAPVQASIPPMPSQGPNVSPMALSAWSASASAPPGETATATNASPPSSTAAAAGGVNAASGPMSVIAVPSGVPIFMISGGKTVTIAKRALATPEPVVAATASVTEAAAHKYAHLHPRQFRAGDPQHGHFRGF